MGTVFQIHFSESARRVEGGLAVYPNTLLFRAGYYEDKHITVTPDELRDATNPWEPLSGGIEHSDFMRGRAVHINRAWTTDAGATLRGEVRLPLALDELLTDNERKISMEFNRLTRKPVGVALVTRPRVSDAVLMSVDKKTPPRMATAAEIYARREAQIAKYREGNH